MSQDRDSNVVKDPEINKPKKKETLIHLNASHVSGVSKRVVKKMSKSGKSCGIDLHNAKCIYFIINAA